MFQLLGLQLGRAMFDAQGACGDPDAERDAVVEHLGSRMWGPI